MMRWWWSGLACTVFLLSACDAEVRHEDDVVDGEAYDGEGGDDGPGGSGEGDARDRGIPCRFLHGEVTIPDWRGEPAPYGDSLFSFELASTGTHVHRNDGDLGLLSGMLCVNTVTDDRSFIVDLGVVPLTEVPETVDPEDFEVGNWGEHDHLGPLLDHTYVVRTIDGNSRLWAAFRVVAIVPGQSVTIDWARSTDAERFIHPSWCD